VADFEREDARLDRDEGVYSDLADDPGGETVLGVARTRMPDWGGFPLVDGIKSRLGLASPIRDAAGVRRMCFEIQASREIQGLARSLRRIKFWEWFGLDSCPSQIVAGEIYNGAYNSGRARQRLIVARALNVLNEDGRLYADLPLGEPSRLPDGMLPSLYAMLPAWVRTPIQMVYPADLRWGAPEAAALNACLASGREDRLHKTISGIRAEWLVSWIERNKGREGLTGVLARPYSRA
jgi:hypothetical protein